MHDHVSVRAPLGMLCLLFGASCALVQKLISPSAIALVIRGGRTSLPEVGMFLLFIVGGVFLWDSVRAGEKFTPGCIIGPLDYGVALCETAAVTAALTLGIAVLTAKPIELVPVAMGIVGPAVYLTLYFNWYAASFPQRCRTYLTSAVARIRLLLQKDS